MKKIVIWIFLISFLALTCNKAEARDIKQSTAANVMVFMTDSTDHVSGKASLTLTITASKDGAGFNSITPTVTERGTGWYNLALTATDTNTLGDFALHITATGADSSDMKHTIVANIEADTYAEATNASYGLAKLVRSTTPANTLDVAATGEAGVDLSNINGTLDAAEIGTGAITNLKFAAGAIDAAAIATDAIGAAKVANGTIDALTFAAGAIDAAAIAAGAITSSEFAQSAADLVWSTAARTITGGAVTTNNDKTGYSLTTLESAGLHSGTAQAGAAGTITLAAGASATNDLYKGLVVKIYGGTGAGQARTITAYDGTTKAAAVAWNWTTAPDATSTYALLSLAHPSVNSSLQVATTASDPWGTALPGSYGAGTAGYILGTNLNATVLSRSSHSAADIWGVGTRTLTSGGYSGLSAADVDLIWDEARSGHTTAGTFGQGVASVQGNVTGSVASVTGSVGSVTGAVGSVTSGVTVTTNNDKTGYSLAADQAVNVTKWSGTAVATPDTAGYPKVTIKSGTGTGEVSLSSGVVTVGTNNDKTGYRLSATGVDDIWDEVQSGHTTAGTFGKYIDAQVSGVTAPSAATVAAAVWNEPLAGYVTAGTAGKKLSDLPTSGTGDWTSGEKTLIKQSLGINDGDVDAGGDLDSIFMEIRRSRGR